MADQPLLQIEDLSRSFGETRALVGASLRVGAGEIHALCGENGSGKTTLIKVLSGIIRPDTGSLTWKGEVVRPANPSTAQGLGVATVFQETLVVHELSVVENIFMGMDGVFRRGRRPAEEAAVAREVLAAIGAGDLDIHRPIWSLTLAERQLVTIARAMVRPWQLMVLDEGTSALDSSQRDLLFAYLRECSAQGKSVLFTSHRMDEVESLADQVTVLRLGSTVAAMPTKGTSAREILGLMAGQEAADAVVPEPAAEARDRSEQLAAASESLLAEDVALTESSRPHSLAVRAGEIVGLAGLEGHGQLEFAKVLAGLARPAAGRVTVLMPDGQRQPVRRFSSTKKLGVAYVPRDRKQEGLFYPLSIFENFGIASLAEASTFGFVRFARLKRAYETYAARLRLKAGGPRDLIGTLSGGNQQKVLLARWLATDPSVLILNDPLRGVDANTKEELYTLLRELADQGMAIVLLSTELLELLTVCDRIAVFHRGSIGAVLDAHRATDTDIVAAMFAHDENPEGAAAR